MARTCQEGVYPRKYMHQAKMWLLIVSVCFVKRYEIAVKSAFAMDFLNYGYDN